jgi:PAS domain S-box-containing protein
MTGPLVQARICLALDEQSTVLAVSAGMHALLGYSAEDFLSSRVSLAHLIHPGDRDIAALLFSTDSPGNSGAFHFRLRHADGKIRCIWARYNRKCGETGEKEILELSLQDAKSLFQSQGSPDSLTAIAPTMEIVHDALYFKNSNYVFTAANQKMRQAFPSVGGNVLGLTDYDLFPEEDADISYELDKQVLTGSPVARETQVMLLVDGLQHWIDHLKYPVRDPNGEVIGLFGVGIDVTRRKNFEVRIQESESLLREAQTNAGIGSYVTDLRRMQWTSSEVMDQIFGIGKDYDRSVEGWSLLVHPDDRDSMVTYFVSEVAGLGKPFDREYRIIRPSDGAVRWVHGLGRLEFDGSGELARMLGTIQDITERRNAQDALRESKELLGLFIEHAPAALAMLDREMRYLAVSHRWLEVHSFLDRDVIGHSHCELFPKSAVQWKEEHRRALAGEAIPADEILLENVDGSAVWIKRRIQPWRTGDGAVGGILFFTEDITRQRESE